MLPVLIRSTGIFSPNPDQASPILRKRSNTLMHLFPLSFSVDSHSIIYVQITGTLLWLAKVLFTDLLTIMSFMPETLTFPGRSVTAGAGRQRFLKLIKPAEPGVPSRISTFSIRSIQIFLSHRWTPWKDKRAEGSADPALCKSRTDGCFPAGFQ